MTDAELTTQAIAASGLTAGLFARCVLGIDPRSVTRWRAGGRIPPARRAWLEVWLGMDAETRRRIVADILEYRRRADWVMGRKGVRA